MKIIYRFIVVTLLGCMSVVASAQTKQQLKTDSVFKLFKARYNDRDVNGIYALTGSQFKLSAQTFRSIIEQQLLPYGQIKADSLISFINNDRGLYYLRFDAITYHLTLRLDKDNKIGVFIFQPAQDEADQEKNQKVPTSNPMVSAMDRTVDSIARLYIKKSNTVGLSLGIIKNGKTEVYHYGETTRGNNKLPDNNTIFELGSVTKTFTGILLAYYVNEGKISLNDPVTKFLPAAVAANPALKDIKLVNLSNHSSGLPGLPANFNEQRPYDEANPYKNYNKQLLLEYLQNCTLQSKPGEKYAYSNLAVGLLGIILEKVSGKPFEQMVSEVILQPLAMKGTVQHLYPMLSARFATVYDESGKPTPAWDFDAMAAIGSLRSSMNDMLLYTRANMGNNSTTKLAKAINLARKISFTDNDVQLGLGWHISIIQGVEYYYHSGGTGGSSSFLAFNDAKKLAVIILSNSVESTDPVGVKLIEKLQ